MYYINYVLSILFIENMTDNNRCTVIFSLVLLLALVVGFVFLINYETNSSSAVGLTTQPHNNNNNNNQTVLVSSSSSSTATTSSSSSIFSNSSNTFNQTELVDEIVADIEAKLLNSYPTTTFLFSQLAGKLNNTGPATFNGNLTVTGTLLSATTTVAPAPASSSILNQQLLAAKLNNTGPALFTGNLTVASGSLTVDGNTYPTTLGSTGQFLTTDGHGNLSWGTVAVPSSTANKLNNTGPATFTGNLTVTGGSLTVDGNTFPTSLGSSGQILTTDGAGNLSWQTPVSSSSSSALSSKLNNTGPAIFTGNLTVTGGSFTADGNTYPTTLGSNGQVISTDGAGHLNWISLPTPSGIHLSSVTLTASQINNLATTAVILVPASTGFAINIISVSFNLQFNSVAYSTSSGNGVIGFYYDQTQTTSAFAALSSNADVSSTFDISPLLTQTVSATSNLNNALFTVITALKVNVASVTVSQPIYLNAVSGSYSVSSGNSPVTIAITYTLY